MRLLGRIFFLQVLFIVHFNACLYGQADSAETLQSMLLNASSETEIANLYGDLSSLYSTKDPQKGLDYAQIALTMSQKLKDDSLMILAYLSLGVNFMHLRMNDSSIYYTRQALIHSRKTNIKNYNFNIYNNFGNTYLEIPHFDSARYYFALCQQIAEDEENQARLAAVYNNLGLIYMEMGEMQESYENYIKALQLFEDLGENNEAATILNNIGLVNHRIGNDEKAVEYFMKAIEINLALDSPLKLSMNYANLGISYKNLGALESALEYYNKSNEIAEQHGLINDLARNYLNVGNIYFHNNEMKLAKQSFLKSLEISLENNIKIGILLNNLMIGDIELRENDLVSAEGRMNTVYELIKETGLVRYTQNYLDLMSSLNEKKGDFKLALDYHKKYKNDSDSLLELANKQQVEALQTAYETEKNLLENQKLRDQNLLNEKIIQNQRLVGLVIIITLILSALLAITFYRSRQRLTRAFQSLTKLNEQVLIQSEKLEESNQTKDKMFSIIAHDLRSPFNSLMGFLDILIDEFGTLREDEKVKMLGIVHNQSVTTYGLLENLLQWSLMQRDLVEVSFQQLDLHLILQTQISDLYGRAENKQISIYNNILPNTMIQVDENIAKTIFRNLIINSIKFTGRGGKIVLDAETSESGLTVRVIDDGIGMSAETISNLFNKHMPESRKGTNNEVGTGLGLRIVRDCVEKINAQISAESKVGEGSVFSVIFPIIQNGPEENTTYPNPGNSNG